MAVVVVELNDKNRLVNEAEKYDHDDNLPDDDASESSLSFEIARRKFLGVDFSPSDVVSLTLPCDAKGFL